MSAAEPKKRQKTYAWKQPKDCPIRLMAMPGGEVIRAEAPANLAMIKYMGKEDPILNLPYHDSLSYTLTGCRSRVEVQWATPGAQCTQWRSLNNPGSVQMGLNRDQVLRFLGHVEALQLRWDCKRPLLVSSSNNFPVGCGLASSSSSFAAVTAAVSAFMCRAYPDHPETVITFQELVWMSRCGSGSSSRSFRAPWVRWHAQTGDLSVVESPHSELRHLTVMVNERHKEIGSTEAHKRVLRSEQFQGRPERAMIRMEKLIKALNKGDWRGMFRYAWQECWDMHALFACANRPFVYWHPASYAVLKDAVEYWEKHLDGPVVTVDAGPNVHLLFRADQEELALAWSNRYMARGVQHFLKVPSIRAKAYAQGEPLERPELWDSRYRER